MTSIILPTLTVRFSLPLQPHQIPQWRGAVAEAAGDDLFHNHNNRPDEPILVGEGQLGVGVLLETIRTSKKYHYRLPLIQYRVIDGQAGIFAIGEGVPILRRWLLSHEEQIRVGGKVVALMIDGMQERKYQVRMLPEMRTYRLMDYLPFHAENYLKWQQADDLIERIQLLQNTLTGQILGLTKGLGFWLPERLELRILTIRKTRSLKVHGTQHLGFNLIYKANIELPPNIAIGRSVSHGFGTQRPVRGNPDTPNPHL
ncbi:MAG: CRISPR-associated endonuclease Cas6 [Bacteroidota bacterium]